MKYTKTFLENLSKNNHDNFTLDSIGIILLDYTTKNNHGNFKIYKFVEEDKLFGIVIEPQNRQPISFPISIDKVIKILENPKDGESMVQNQLCTI